MADKPRPRIIVAGQLSESATERLQKAGEVIFLDKGDERTLSEAVMEADALVVRTYAEVTHKVILAAKEAGRLRVIGRAGVGVDNIDVRAAHGAGITVVHTPAACTSAVADLTVGLILAVQRKIVVGDRKLREGEFKSLRAGVPDVRELQHQTLGVIGMGRIGRAVGTRLHNGFDMRVIYYDIREIGLLPFAAEPRRSANEVYAEADVVTLHVPLTSLTRGMINEAALEQFKQGAVLINTSRGPVVEAQALAKALEAGRLSGAGIDVFDPEPPPSDHPLLSAPNGVLTPHIASRSYEGITAMNDVVDDVIGVLTGKEPMYPADPNLG